jgi:hypothetical protein
VKLKGALLLSFLAVIWVPTPAVVSVSASGIAMPKPNPVPSLASGSRVTNRAGNLGGKVLVLMYHRAGPKEQFMVRSRANFRADLMRLRQAGYRPVTISEYVENRMPLPPGASPVVVSFDDSHSTQLNFQKDGSVDPNTFVGMWMEFATRFPDFPVKGTFYANNNGPFGRDKDGKKAITLLQGLGSEIAAHTARHVNLAKVSRDKGMREIVSNIAYLEKRGAKVQAFAPPYGVYPSRSWLESGFVYKGRRVKFNSIVEAWDRPAHSPISSRMNPNRIPRVQAYPGVRGFTWWMDMQDKGLFEAYVQP